MQIVWFCIKNRVVLQYYFHCKENQACIKHVKTKMVVSSTKLIAQIGHRRETQKLKIRNLAVGDSF